MKMSKSSQTTKSITSLEKQILKNAKIRQIEYHIVRENLRRKYAKEKKSFYWIQDDTNKFVLRLKRIVYNMSIKIWRLMNG